MIDFDGSTRRHTVSHFPHGARAGRGGSGDCWGVLLAAGEGRRFGRGKLTVPLRGRPLVAHVLSAIDLARMQGSLAGAIAVIPAGDHELRSLVEGVDLMAVENAEAPAGLARSLRLGLEFLGREELAPRPGAAVVVLGDQPLVRAGVIGRLVEARLATGARIVRPRYAVSPDEPGHPVVIDRSVWTLAERLEGDSGLAPLLAEHPEWLAVVDVSGANPDVDEPRDLEELERRI